MSIQKTQLKVFPIDEKGFVSIRPFLLYCSLRIAVEYQFPHAVLLLMIHRVTPIISVSCYMNTFWIAMTKKLLLGKFFLMVANKRKA